MDELSKKVVQKAEKLMAAKRPAGRPVQDTHAHDDLLPLNSAILMMMEQSFSLSVITEAIKESGINISKSSVRSFMKMRFPDLYKANYTQRAPLKPGQKKRIKPLQGSEVKSKSKKKEADPQSMDHSASSIASRMIEDAIN